MTAAAPLDPKYVSLLWAGPDQAGAIAGLHTQLFNPPWDEAGIRTLLDHPASTAFVAMIGNPKSAVGFVMGQIAADEAEILSIGVAEPWQRKGIGRRLVDGLARAVKKAEGRSIFLEVAADNPAALGLYRRLGFQEAGRRKDYYARPGGKSVDAMRLTLAI
jgi:[ribosomal protein S18]-alanine N-acetyltransferase